MLHITTETGSFDPEAMEAKSKDNVRGLVTAMALASGVVNKRLGMGEAIQQIHRRHKEESDPHTLPELREATSEAIEFFAFTLGLAGASAEAWCYKNDGMNPPEPNVEEATNDLLQLTHPGEDFKLW